MTDQERIEIEEKTNKYGLLQFRGYFEKENYLFDNLKENKITFSDRSIFNDPFDCNLPIDLGDEREWQTYLKKFGNNDEEYIKQRAKELSKDPEKTKNIIEGLIYDNRRFSCFTIASQNKHLTNTKFWANYANKHKGICMKFSSSFLQYFRNINQNNIHFIPIEYCKTNEIPSFNYLTNRLNGKPEYASQYFFGTKSINWKDEEEVRLVYYSNEKIKEKYIDIEFDPKHLREVYFGCNMTCEDIKKLRTNLDQPKYSHVQLFKLEKDTKFFQLNPRRIK